MINRTWQERLDFYKADSKKVLPLLLVGLALILGGLPAARVTGWDFLAPWGLLFGGSFWVVALSHILRRTLFPWLDLQKLTDKASEEPVGAALVFVGVCIVLTAFVALAASALK